MNLVDFLYTLERHWEFLITDQKLKLLITILKDCNESMVVNRDCFMAVNINDELSSIGLDYLFDDTSTNRFKNYKIIEWRI